MGRVVHNKGENMKRALAFLVTLWSFAASAIIPENGWWWASNESGRGFNIEVQDNQLFFATFGYESNGSPGWMVADGSMSSDRDFTGGLLKFTAGQCFGCPYVAPVQINAGTLTLRFTSSQTAILTINGTSISVKRFDFWQNEAVPDGMMGEWSMVMGESAFPVFGGERVQFSSRQSGSNGVFLGGQRLGSPGNLAVVNFLSGSYSILLDSSTSFYRMFRFNTTGFNRVEGQWWVFDKNAQPTGSGEFFQGFRTASASFVRTGAGPASTKALSVESIDVLQGMDEAMAKRHLGAEPASDDVLRDFEVLKRSMQQLRTRPK